MAEGSSQPAGQKAKLSRLQSLQELGAAEAIAEKILNLMGHSDFFEDFTNEDVQLLSKHMRAYRADPGQEIIHEGDTDDFMLLIIEGSVSIVKVDSHGEIRPMSVVRAGSTLGEMSMIDGEPRFASCIAIDTTTFVVLSRDAMVDVIMNEPALGAKVLIKLVTMMSQRLRNTSNSLIEFMERTDAV